MKNIFKYLIALFAIATLVACGGGGGPRVEIRINLSW